MRAIFKISTGKPPVNIPLPENEDLIDTILSHYENHTSINAIKEMNINSTFEIPLADEETIERIMKKHQKQQVLTTSQCA